MAIDISRAHILAKNIDLYLNYDSNAEKAAKEGLCMKEDKDFYKEGILTGISNIFDGLTYEEIYAILIDCVAYADVKNPQE